MGKKLLPHRDTVKIKSISDNELFIHYGGGPWTHIITEILPDVTNGNQFTIV